MQNIETKNLKLQKYFSLKLQKYFSLKLKPKFAILFLQLKMEKNNLIFLSALDMVILKFFW